MSKRRTGLPSLSYMGVEAPSPPNLVRVDRSPTVNDYQEFNIGALWLRKNTEEIWMLVDKKNHVATWIRLGVGGGGVITQVDGGLNINTVNPTGPVVTVNLDALTRGVVQADAAGIISSSEGTDGQILISSSAGPPVWANITAGANITVTDGANSIIISASGGGGGGLTNIPTDSGTAVISGAFAIDVIGGTNMNTEATGASEVSVHLDDDVTLVGFLDAGTSVSAGTTITAGTDITSTAGNLAVLSGNASVSGTLTVSSLGRGVVQTSAAGLFSSSEGTDGQLLISSSAGATAWANLASAGGTVTITNGANTINLEAAGGGAVLPGDNININPASTVNLNKSIFQPITNATGTEGLYALGGSDFMHNYGVRNTFLGENAGNRTLAPGYGIDNASDNTGIGWGTLKHLTSGTRNTAIGQDALGSVQGGHFTWDYGSENVAIGAGAGVWLVGGSKNILIGYNAAASSSAGITNSIIMNNTGAGIGSNHTFIGNSNTTAASMPGIYGVAPNPVTSPRIMMVANTDQLGVSYGETQGDVLMGYGPFQATSFGTVTSSNNTILIDKTTPGNINLEYTGASLSAFRAYQTINIANTTGDGSTYWLGCQTALSEEYDTGNDFYPGNGSGVTAKFTAPIDGLYNFTLSILLTNILIPLPPLPPAPPAPTCGDPVSIVTTGQTYMLINPALVYAGEQTLFYTVFAVMNAGHTAQFNCAIITDYLTRTVGVGATHTWVGGFLVSAM